MHMQTHGPSTVRDEINLLIFFLPNLFASFGSYFFILLHTKKLIWIILIIADKGDYISPKYHLFSFLYSRLEGFYVDDALQGQGIYTYEDGGALHGTYVEGELNGPAQEFNPEGQLVFRGQYKDNIRYGMCWVYYPVCCAQHQAL